MFSVFDEFGTEIYGHPVLAAALDVRTDTSAHTAASIAAIIGMIVCM